MYIISSKNHAEKTPSQTGYAVPCIFNIHNLETLQARC